MLWSCWRQLMAIENICLADWRTALCFLVRAFSSFSSFLSLELFPLSCSKNPYNLGTPFSPISYKVLVFVHISHI